MDIPLPLLVSTILSGLVVGSMYAIVASGLTLIWGTMKMLNFAHGEFFMLGGYLLYYLYGVLGWPPFWATVATTFIVFVLGILVERLVITHLLDKPDWILTTIIATIGLSIVLQNAALLIWGPEFHSIDYFWPGISVFFGIRIANQRILILLVSVVSISALWLFFKYSRFGLALRATAQDRDAASLYGVNVKRVFTLTFGISAALAALAAAMLVPITAINPFVGMDQLLKGFVVVILGGLGSFSGAILGGLLLGVVESLGVLFTSTEWSDVIAFGLLVIFIVVRPWGLFGIAGKR